MTSRTTTARDAALAANARRALLGAGRAPLALLTGALLLSGCATAGGALAPRSADRAGAPTLAATTAPAVAPRLSTKRLTQGEAIETADTAAPRTQLAAEPAKTRHTAQQTTPETAGAVAEDDLAAAGFADDPRATFTIAADNDLFGGTGDDRQYTSGVFGKVLLPRAATPFLDRPFWDGIFGPSARRLELQIGQQIFTPDDLSASGPIPDDRPYGAFLFVSAEIASMAPNQAILGFEALVEDRGGVQIGAVGGDAALGEQAQDAARTVFGGGRPNGYDNGLDSEPGFNIVASRAYRVFGRLGPLDTEVKPFVDLSAGTVLNQASLGLTLRVGDDVHYDLNRLDYRTGTSSGGWFGPEDGFAWSLSLGAQGRAVARSVFLDGNVFADGPDDAIDVDRNLFVMDAHWGVSVATDRFRASYQMVFRSKEFEEQDERTVFGTIALSAKF